MKVYRIKGWSENFEKADNRKTAQMHWVAVPTRHDGKGFRRIGRREDAFVIFGAWNLIVQVAAKMPKRGTLLDDDGAVGPEEMELITGFPADGFAKALEVLSDPKIGWVETVDMPELNPPSGDHPEGIRTPSGGHPATEQNRTIQNNDVGAGVRTGGAAEPTPPPPSEEDAAAVVEALRKTGFGWRDIEQLRTHPRATLERIATANANYDHYERTKTTKGSRTGYVRTAILEWETLSLLPGAKSAQGRKTAGTRIEQQQQEQRRQEESGRHNFEEANRIVSELPESELQRHVTDALASWPEETRVIMRKRDPRKFQTWVSEIAARVTAERSGRAGASPPARPAMRLAQ